MKLRFVNFYTNNEHEWMKRTTRQAREGPKNHVFDGGAHWRHLVNTTERPVCGSDAALCEIAVPACRNNSG